MSGAVTCIGWIPKGVAKAKPEKWNPTDEDLERLEEMYGLEGDIDEGGVGTQDVDMLMDGGEVEEADPTEDPNAMDEDLEKYDKEDARNALSSFSVNTAEEHDMVFNDPLLTAEQQESDSDDEDHVIKASDNLFVACSCEDDECNLEVYLYDQENGAMFVHHDLKLNAYPLCSDWVNMGQGKNYCAVGQFDNNIDIWDLDVLDPMEPVMQLKGGSAEAATPQDSTKTSNKKGKKKKVQKKPPGVAQTASADKSTSSSAASMGHMAPVMTLNVHPTEHHILASGSADNTVKIWDLNQQKVVHTFDHHKDKVQCARWHRQEQSVLLTAGYDKKMCLLDVRKSASSAASLSLSADAEQALWNQEDGNLCYVSTEDGKVVCYDARMIAQGTSTNPLYTLSAYNSKTACSGLAQRGNVLVTGGMDGVAKVFDLRQLASGNMDCLFEKTMAIGSIYTCAGAQHKSNEDSMFLFGGSTVAMWDLASEKKLCDQFNWKYEGKETMMPSFGGEE